MTATLPSYVKIHASGFGEERESALIRTEMESGPPKQAKVRSRVMVNRPVNLLVSSKADYLTFITWFGSTINQGADWFNFTDPVDGTTKLARIKNGDIKARQGGTLTGPWLINCVLETWSA